MLAASDASCVPQLAPQGVELLVVTKSKHVTRTVVCATAREDHWKWDFNDDEHVSLVLACMCADEGSGTVDVIFPCVMRRLVRHEFCPVSDHVSKSFPWALARKARNKLVHALHGNGGVSSSNCNDGSGADLVTALLQIVQLLQNPDGMQKLQSALAVAVAPGAQCQEEQQPTRGRSRSRKRGRGGSRSTSRHPSRPPSALRTSTPSGGKGRELSWEPALSRAQKRKAGKAAKQQQQQQQQQQRSGPHNTQHNHQQPHGRRESGDGGRWQRRQQRQQRPPQRKSGSGGDSDDDDSGHDGWKLRSSDWATAKLSDAEGVFVLNPDDAPEKKVVVIAPGTSDIPVMAEHAKGQRLRLTIVKRVHKDTTTIPESVLELKPAEAKFLHVPGLVQGRVKVCRCLLVRLSPESPAPKAVTPVKVDLPPEQRTRVLRFVVDSSYVVEDRWSKVRSDPPKALQQWALQALSLDAKRHVLSAFHIFHDEAGQGRHERVRGLVRVTEPAFKELVAASGRHSAGMSWFF